MEEQRVFVSPQVLSGRAKLRVEGLPARLVQGDDELVTFWPDRCQVFNGPMWHWGVRTSGTHYLRDPWFATVIKARRLGPFSYRLEHEGTTYDLHQPALAEWGIYVDQIVRCEIRPATHELEAISVPVVVVCLSMMIIFRLHRDTMAASATFLPGPPSSCRWRQQVVVPAPPENVFTYVADLTHLPEWSNLRLTDQPPHVLQRGMRLAVRWEPIPDAPDETPEASGTLTVTAVDPHTQLGWITKASESARLHHTQWHMVLDFLADPRGTLIQMTTEIPFPSPIGLRRVQEGYFLIEAGNQLQRIKRVLELATGHPPPPPPTRARG